MNTDFKAIFGENRRSRGNEVSFNFRFPIFRMSLVTSAPTKIGIFRHALGKLRVMKRD
jgi:hypothetical protein